MSADQTDMGFVEAVRLSKQAVRKAMAQQLGALPVEVLAEQSAQVTDLVLQHEIWNWANRVCFYLSTPRSEVQTDALIKAALLQGKSVYVPHCPDAYTMRMLRLRNAEELMSLPLNTRGIREHVKVDGLEEALDVTRTRLDLILAPGVAFDRERNRLGHGRGYYDRYIAESQKHARMHSLGPPVVAGLALREQVLTNEVLPVTSTDRRLDMIFTPDTIISLPPKLKGSMQMSGLRRH